MSDFSPLLPSFDFSPLLPSFNQHMRDGQPLIKCQPCSVRRRRFLHCFLNAPCQSSLADQNLDVFPLYFTSPANRPPSYPIVHASLQKYNATINHRCRLLGGDGGPDIFIGGEGDVTCVRAAANTSTANSSVKMWHWSWAIGTKKDAKMQQMQQQLALWASRYFELRQ